MASLELSSVDVDEMEKFLSPSRYASYVRVAGGDRRLALELYHLNTTISAALYPLLQALEIVLRNTVNATLTGTHGEAWYDKSHNLHHEFDYYTKRQIKEAIHQVNNNNKRKGEDERPIRHGDVVANLSFGFWVSLLGKGRHKEHNPNSPKAFYDEVLWRRSLYDAFPNANNLARSHLAGKMDNLKHLRNRIAHHEPIIFRHLNPKLIPKNTQPHEQYDLTVNCETIVEIVGWISATKQEWVRFYYLDAVLKEIQKLDQIKQDLA